MDDYEVYLELERAKRRLTPTNRSLNGIQSKSTMDYDHFLKSISVLLDRIHCQDGQYEYCVREKVNLIPIPGRPDPATSRNFRFSPAFRYFQLVVFQGVKRLKKKSIWETNLGWSRIGAFWVESNQKHALN